MNLHENSFCWAIVTDSVLWISGCRNIYHTPHKKSSTSLTFYQSCLSIMCEQLILFFQQTFRLINSKTCPGTKVRQLGSLFCIRSYYFPLKEGLQCMKLNNRIRNIVRYKWEFMNFRTKIRPWSFFWVLRPLHGVLSRARKQWILYRSRSLIFKKRKGVVTKFPIRWKFFCSN